MTAISTADLHWAVGFLEGEGSFLSGRRIAVEASQVQKWPIERLIALFGGRARLYAVDATKSRASSHWRWVLMGPRAMGLMMTVYSLMSPRRREQVRAAIETWRSRPGRNQDKTICKRGHPFTAKNTYKYLDPGGWIERSCRACRNAHAKASKIKKRSAGCLRLL